MMETKIKFCGHYVTQEQKEGLLELLEEDILERYNNEEYWNESIIECFVTDDNIKKVDEE